MINEALAQLASNGFLVRDRFLDANTTDCLIAHFETLSGDGTESSARTRRGVVFARRNLLLVPFVQQFVRSGPVRDLIDPIGPELLAVRAILFDKTGEANWTVPWHQDRSIAVQKRVDVPGFGPWSEKAGVVHVQPPLDLLARMVTLRFSLDPCGPENGPLRVIPGTHRILLDRAGVDRAVELGPQHSCITEAGGVVVMRPLVMHASSPAQQVAHRRVLHVEFGPPALPGGLRWAIT